MESNNSPQVCKHINIKLSVCKQTFYPLRTDGYINAATDAPVFFGSFLLSLPDLEVILLVCLPEGAADVCLPSLGGTAEVRGSFSIADWLFGFLVGCPVPVRTQKAFSKARSSSSRSSLSPGEISVLHGSSIYKH